PPIVPGVKTQLLEQFKTVNQNRFNEAKLRERKQGIEESTIEYFYDILDLCRRVDPNVSKAMKLAHLWRGLKPSLLEKLWNSKPNSCDEFLQEIKRYQEMTSRARHEEWAIGVIGKQTPTAGSERMDRIEKLLEGLMGLMGTADGGTFPTYSTAHARNLLEQLQVPPFLTVRMPYIPWPSIFPKKSLNAASGDTDLTAYFKFNVVDKNARQ
ncbi:Uncharacterized protein APZ42_025516, partial [Daphnia magna]